MAKRPAEADDWRENKRQRGLGPEAFDAAAKGLLENTDELIESLQELKRHGGALSSTFTPEMRLQLGRLSKKLAPSFSTLGESCSDEVYKPSINDDRQRVKQPPHDGRHTLPSIIWVTTPWTLTDIPSQLPPLPKILNPELEEMTFRHPALAFGDGESYERLEWLGDAWLELIASHLIYQTFSHLPSGRCSQIRESLIRNKTLAEFFRQYGLTSRANLPHDIVARAGGGRSADKDLHKTQSDMFEAYVAAVVLSSPEGPTITVDWLKALWSMTLRTELKQSEQMKVVVQAQDATVAKGTLKDQLGALITVKGVKLDYRDMPGSGEKKDRKLNLPLFVIGVYLTGWGEQDKLLGTGSALSKKEAGLKAAKMALDNKKLIGVYEKKKKAFMEAQAAAA